jgi:hypothetical protein
MSVNFQGYDPMRMESELQEAKLQQKDPEWSRRDYGKRILLRVVVIVVCVAALYLLTR